MSIFELRNTLRGTKEDYAVSRSTQDSRLYDLRNFHISLKQWRTLHAVVDCGGFNGAATKLHVSQSAISYTVAKLQEQLGLPLLKIEGRKAYLTDEGRMLLDRSRNLIREAIQLELLAENLRMGWHSEISLMVDHDFPTNVLMLSLRKFSQVSENVKVTLREASTLQVERALNERTVNLAISQIIPPGFTGDMLIGIEHVAVAHPAHPLFSLGRTLTAADLKRQVQVVNTNTPDTLRDSGKHYLSGGQKPWNVGSFDTAVSALQECLGYAWLPKHRLEQWLARGDLRILPLNAASTFKTNLYLVHGRLSGLDKATRMLADVLLSFASAEVLLREAERT